MQSEVELDDGPPPGLESITPQPPPGFESISPQPPPPLKESVSPQPPPASEMAQMVCGSCRRLLKYPRGARHVQCSCCQTFNFVLEAHQVGQVDCGNCAVLLMYPFGAPAVRCSSCNFVTEVVEHNKRPPWSAQQGQRQPPLAPNPVC